MEQLQGLLVESKAEVSQLTGKLRATENQVDSLQKSKDEVMGDIYKWVDYILPQFACPAYDCMVSSQFVRWFIRSPS